MKAELSDLGQMEQVVSMYVILHSKSFTGNVNQKSYIFIELLVIAWYVQRYTVQLKFTIFDVRKDGKKSQEWIQLFYLNFMTQYIPSKSLLN